MSALAQADRLARAGRQQEAVALVEQAADRGDAEALFMIANWRLLGMYGARDLARAHELLGQAAQRGHVEAARTRAHLIGNGTGCPADPERAKQMLRLFAPRDQYASLQLSFLPRMLPVARATPKPAEQLSQEPQVRRIKGLLVPEECNYLRTLAEPTLQPSFVIDPRTGARVPNPIRTSTGMSFGPVEEDLVVHELNRRIAAVTGTEAAWGEPLHILRYQPGQEYKPHLDALPGEPNQRHWTVLVYLNDDYRGGETHFPDLGIKVRGRLGDALIFGNVGPDGRADPRTRHAGCAVRSGTKWLATRWIRAAPYHPWEDA